MSNIDITKNVYEAFAKGDMETVLGAMNPDVTWNATPGLSHYGGSYNGPQAVVESVFAKLPEIWDDLNINIERLIDGGNIVVMQGHYEAKSKATGKAVRTAVSHIIEFNDGKVVRFDQYADSATANASHEA